MRYAINTNDSLQLAAGGQVAFLCKLRIQPTPDPRRWV